MTDNASVGKERCYIEYELLSYSPGKRPGNYCTILLKIWPSKPATSSSTNKILYTTEKNKENQTDKHPSFI